MIRGIDRPSPPVIELPINTAQRLMKAHEDFRDSDLKYQQAATGIKKSVAFEERRIAENLLDYWTGKAQAEFEEALDTSLYEIIAHLALFGKNQN